MTPAGFGLGPSSQAHRMMRLGLSQAMTLLHELPSSTESPWYARYPAAARLNFEKDLDPVVAYAR